MGIIIPIVVIIVAIVVVVSSYTHPMFWVNIKNKLLGIANRKGK